MPGFCRKAIRRRRHSNVEQRWATVLSLSEARKLPAKRQSAIARQSGADYRGHFSVKYRTVMQTSIVCLQYCAIALYM